MSRGLFSGHNQYSYLLIQQRDGIKDGLALTQITMVIESWAINETVYHFRSLTRFGIAVPIMRLETQDTPDTDTGSNVSSAVTIAVVGGLV